MGRTLVARGRRNPDGEEGRPRKSRTCIQEEKKAPKI
jgi:hypothetical protein